MQFYIDSSQIHLANEMIYYGSIELAHADEKSRLISTSENWTARIRYKDETTILTLKGKRRKSTALELEWLIERAKGEEIEEKAPNTADAMKRYKSGKAGFTDKAHLKAKGLIPRADGTKRKSDKYK